MVKTFKPPRPWTIDDLFDLGKKSGVTHLKAIPVLILEKWIQDGREDGVANYYFTNQLAKRLEKCDLVQPFKPKGTSSLVAAMSAMQRSRNLTRPPLIEYQGDGITRVTLPYYEQLLQEYRQQYKILYAEDYDRLFKDGEPKWESQAQPIIQSLQRENPIISEELEKISSLLGPVEDALRKQQKTIKKLGEENESLQAKMEKMETKATVIRFVHTSPDFLRNVYGKKVTSIKEIIGNMLNSAEHTIRISTRQMDMFTDELIAIKRHNPNLEITVLSRGPERAEGDRKKLAGVAFEKMKGAGIKLIVEKDSLHSRLVIIDTSQVLVSSADLDYTQMDLEFNAGIWTNDLYVVTESIRFFENLIGLSDGN